MEWSWKATELGRQIQPGTTEWPKFMSWLNQEREAAQLRRNYQLAKVGTDPRPPINNQPYCVRCRARGHRTQDCTHSNKTTLADINHTSEVVLDDAENAGTTSHSFAITADRERAYKRSEAKAGKCTFCHQHHTYQKTDGTGHLKWPSHQLDSCPKFLKLIPTEKGKKIEELKACPQCTSWLHRIEDCGKKGFTCNRTVNGERCKRRHADMLHDSRSLYCEAHVAVMTAKGTRSTDQKVILLEIQEVSVRAYQQQVVKAILFYDPGATLSLITHLFQTSLILQAVPAQSTWRL